MKPIITVKEARKILGKDSDNMSDDEVKDVIETLDLMAKDSLEKIKQELLMKKDALALANLIYDIYQEDNANKKDPQV